LTERFELLEQIGKGGMGTVWKARDAETGDLVALKLLHEQYADDPEMVNRFEREVDLTRRIDSPYVVKMLGYGQLDGRPYACMEYVPRESLRSVIQRLGPMNWQETQRVLRQVALGLRAAHEAGIIHRDVKPSNVPIAPSGGAKLVAFGIARAADMTALTGPATIMGTAAYTAPEGEHSPAADLYALGCTAYEMLAGEQPFIGDSPSQIPIKHLRDVPDWSRLPRESRDIVGWLLKKDPRDRLGSARQLLALLGPLRAEPPPSSAGRIVRRRRPSPPPRGQIVRRRGREESSRVRPIASTPRPSNVGAQSLQAMRASTAGGRPAANVVQFPRSIAGRRVASATVDFLILIASWPVVAPIAGVGVAVAATGLVWFAAFLLESEYGRSPGKLVFGLVVVESNGDAITVPRSLARTTLKFASVVLWPLALADFVMVIATHGSQKLLDKVTSTEVIDIRDGEDVPL